MSRTIGIKVAVLRLWRGRKAPVGLGIAAGGLFVLRLLYAWTLRVNSDEPQHLHVVWAWTKRLLPYRDVFDNHAPLFDFLNAPLLGLVGERSSAIVLMRIAVIPWYALTLWFTYRLGRVLFDSRTGLWAAALTALLPTFFVMTVQFRPDVAWVALWVALLAIAFEGDASPVRTAGVAMLAGTLCAISLKSVMLFASLGGAYACVSCLRWVRGDRLRWHRLPRQLAIAIPSVALVPVLFAAWFWLRGAWSEFLYCVFAHNLLPGLGRWQHDGARLWTLPIALPFLVAVIWPTLARDRGASRAVAFLGAAFYAIALYGYWPLYTHQDLLPLIPVVMIFVCAGLGYMASAGTSRRYLYTILGIELAGLLLVLPPRPAQMRAYRAELAALFWLTNADDYVMDAKGESIFWRRPYYYALESITRERMRRGLIVDDIARQLVAHATPVVFEFDDKLTEAADRFVDANYVHVSPSILVLGKLLPSAKSGEPRMFAIAVPSRYVLVGPHGAAHGTLDGTPYSGPRRLTVGEHEFVAEDPSSDVAVVWARAIERGYVPLAIDKVRDGRAAAR